MHSDYLNNKSQGSIVKYLRCDGLLYYKVIIQYAGKRVFGTGEHLSKLWTKVQCLVLF